MPSDISVFAIAVWFCVGFFVGAGWAFGAWFIGRVLKVLKSE